MLDHIKGKRIPVKKSASFTLKAFENVDNSKLWNILKDVRIPDNITSTREICIQVKKQQLELNTE